MIINLFNKATKKNEKQKKLNKIIINVEEMETRIAFLAGDRLEQFFIERNSNTPTAGNIYKGIVRNIVPSIQAAFIDIGYEKNGFIHFSDIRDNFSLENFIKGSDEQRTDQRSSRKRQKTNSIADIIKKGKEIIVQVKKQSIGEKGVRLTNNVSLPGRNLVLIPGAKRRGISRKITDRNERKRLKELILELKIPKNFGIIVRTAGEIASNKNFTRDIKYLVKKWASVSDAFNSSKAPSLLHVEFDIALKTLRDLYDKNVDEIIIDSSEGYGKIKKYFKHFFPEIKTKIIHYRRKSPIFDEFMVEKELEKVFQRKVWLPCGGYIIIDETEALVAIDVNTGRNAAHNNLEDTIMTTNIEAAEEIARQMRLRNIGGIIVIDFIDMSKKENRKAVLQKLSRSLSKDKAKTNILPLSAIGLVEMTRQRIKESINQELYEKCECCAGRGMRKSLLSISIETQRKIKRVLLKTREKKIKLILHPDVIDKIKEENKQFPKNFERIFRKKIIIEPNESIDLEKVRAEFLSSKKIELI